MQERDAEHQHRLPISPYISLYLPYISPISPQERDSEHQHRLHAERRAKALDEILRPLQAEAISLREIKAQVPQLRQELKRLTRELEVQAERAAEAEAALREAYKKELLQAEAAVRQEGAAQLAALEDRLAAAAQEASKVEQELGLARQRMEVLEQQISPYISLYLPASPSISLYLPNISLYLPRCSSSR